jgi:hypothetical protein
MMVYAYEPLPVRLLRLLGSDIGSLCIPFAKTPKTHNKTAALNKLPIFLPVHNGWYEKTEA